MSQFNRLGSDHADSERTFFRSSRIALVVGFGGLLLIMALAGIDALRVLQQFRRSDEQIRTPLSLSKSRLKRHPLRCLRFGYLRPGLPARSGPGEGGGVPHQP